MIDTATVTGGKECMIVLTSSQDEGEELPVIQLVLSSSDSDLPSDPVLRDGVVSIRSVRAKLGLIQFYYSHIFFSGSWILP